MSVSLLRRSASRFAGPLVAFVGLCLFGATVHAGPEFTLRGFGTLGATHNFSDGAEVIRDIGQPDGPRDDTSFDLDSRLGVQLDARFTPQLSGAVQLVSAYNYQGKYTPDLQLAFLKYEFKDNYQIRLGRVGWDVYAMSDSRHVGYSFLWARPPVDYFGKLQTDYIDGIDIRSSHRLGNGLLSGKLYAGYSSEETAIDEHSYADADGTFIYGGHLEYHIRNWMVRLSYSHVASETEIRGQQGRELAAIIEFGDPATIAFLEQLGLLNPTINVDIVSAAVTYDRGPVGVLLMFSHDNFTDTKLGDQTHRGFFTASYRLGDWTPYLTYSRSESPATDLQLLPGATLAEDQETFSLGVRYDFYTNLALKIQADHYEVGPEGRGSILWRGVQDDWNGRVNQFSVNLDFIF